jgi:hypothetical protein
LPSYSGKWKESKNHHDVNFWKAILWITVTYWVNLNWITQKALRYWNYWQHSSKFRVGL